METTTTQSETSLGADNANSTASPEPSTRAADFAAPEKCTQNGCSNVGIHHVGIHVKDPLLSAQFYRDILGMQLVGGSPADTPGLGASAFLTSRPGIGTTTFNGLNDGGQIVGFYVNGGGNTIGLIATPKR